MAVFFVVLIFWLFLFSAQGIDNLFQAVQFHLRGSRILCTRKKIGFHFRFSSGRPDDELPSA